MTQKENNYFTLLAVPSEPDNKAYFNIIKII
jgi:hypothetical protein